MFLIPVTRGSQDINRSFDRLFDDAFERFFGSQATQGEGTLAARTPALDVAESDHQYTVTVDLPGVPKENVKITVEGRRVSVEADVRKDEERKDGDRVVYRERSVSRFSRTFSLPSEIDQASSAAKMDHGVLTLTLAKRGATKQAQLTVS